jgi:hypothetical protein
MNPFVPYLVLQRGLFEIAVQSRIGNAITRLVPFRMRFHRPSGILIPPGSARGLSIGAYFRAMNTAVPHANSHHDSDGESGEEAGAEGEF